MFQFLFRKPMAFQPITNDNDELIRSINDDPQRQDDVWQLNDEVDPTKLDKFWDEAIRELKDEATN